MVDRLRPIVLSIAAERIRTLISSPLALSAKA
jgi:hypothetical protein